MNIFKKLFKKSNFSSDRNIPECPRKIPMPPVKSPKKSNADYILEMQNQLSILAERITHMESELKKINPEFIRTDKGYLSELVNETTKAMEKFKIQKICEDINDTMTN